MRAGLTFKAPNNELRQEPSTDGWLGEYVTSPPFILSHRNRRVGHGGAIASPEESHGRNGTEVN